MSDDCDDCSFWDVTGIIDFVDKTCGKMRSCPEKLSYSYVATLNRPWVNQNINKHPKSIVGDTIKFNKTSLIFPSLTNKAHNFLRHQKRKFLPLKSPFSTAYSPYFLINYKHQDPVLVGCVAKSSKIFITSNWERFLLFFFAFLHESTFFFQLTIYMKKNTKLAVYLELTIE